MRRGEAAGLPCDPPSPPHSYSLEPPWPLLKRFRVAPARMLSVVSLGPGEGTLPGCHVNMILGVGSPNPEVSENTGRVFTKRQKQTDKNLTLCACVTA